MQPGYKLNTLTKMFSGFTSLWMMLSECRCSRAEPMSSVNLSVNSFPCPRPWFLSSSIFRFPPAMNSITIASWFWMEMHSITSTILGCFASLTRQNNRHMQKNTHSLYFSCLLVLRCLCDVSRGAKRPNKHASRLKVIFAVLKSAVTKIPFDPFDSSVKA